MEQSECDLDNLLIDTIKHTKFLIEQICVNKIDSNESREIKNTDTSQDYNVVNSILIKNEEEKQKIQTYVRLLT